MSFNLFSEGDNDVIVVPIWKLLLPSSSGIWPAETLLDYTITFYDYIGWSQQASDIKFDIKIDYVGSQYVILWSSDAYLALFCAWFSMGSRASEGWTEFHVKKMLWKYKFRNYEALVCHQSSNTYRTHLESVDLDIVMLFKLRKYFFQMEVFFICRARNKAQKDIWSVKLV